MRVDEFVVKPPAGTPLVATFDEKDLMLLIFEALYSLKRRPGLDRDEALEHLEQDHPEAYAGLQRAAQATMTYLVDRLNAAEPDFPTQGPVQ